MLQLIKLAQNVQRLDTGKKQGNEMDDIWSSFSAALADDKENAKQIEQVTSEVQ